jgi:hypothetical protein
MTVTRLKTLALTLLVLISLVLSYMLWRGAWMNSSEPGLSAPLARETSPYPRLNDAVAPVSIVVETSKPTGASLLVAGSDDYRRWVSLLRSIGLQRLRRGVAATPGTPVQSVVYHFGLQLQHTDLSQWLPALRLSPLDVSGNELELYQTSRRGPVMLAVSFGADRYTAETDLDPARFQQLVSGTITHSPWRVWGSENGQDSLVPARVLRMTRYVCRLSNPGLMPLVHSFFVNPQALTRIQEKKHNVIWTDGTRAVQWEPDANQLTFDDPNTTTAVSEQTELQTVVAYIRNHGGGPESAYLFSADDRSLPGLHTYVLRPTMDGYLVFGTSQTHQVEVENGRVLHYQRPLRSLDGVLSKRTVTVMDGTQLAGVLRRIEGKSATRHYSVTLGYWPQAGSQNEVELEPAYRVSVDGVFAGVIDAVNGQVLEGMKRK